VSGRLRRTAARTGAALVGLRLALAAGERAVRTVAPQSTVTEAVRYEAHPAVGFRMRPWQTIPGRIGGEINGYGLRGERIPSDAGGEERVLALGDSFTFGAGVATEEAFPACLERELAPAMREATGRDLRVVNAGTPSYGTVRELAWLRAFGPELEPDRVVLSVFVGNDFTDNLSPTPAVVEGRLVSAAAAEHPPWQVRARIGLHSSHLDRLAAAALAEREPARPAPPPGPPPDLDDPEIRAAWQRMREDFAAGEADRLAVYTPAGASEAVDRAYEVMAEALDGVRAWCAERGVPLALAIIPDVMQVEDDLLQVAIAARGGSFGDGDYLRPQRTLTAWAEERGVPVLDHLPAFREGYAETGESLYLFGDSHWNAAGHALAAQGLAELLAAELDAPAD